MKQVCLLLLSSVILFSCQREGCTDPSALNYDFKAKKDDGSCLAKDSTFSYTTIQITTNYLSGTNTLTDLPDVEIDYHVKTMINVHGEFYIEPGVTIIFDQGAGFKFEGNVYINGTNESNINFLPASGIWEGISFYGFGKDINIQYLNVTGVGTSPTPNPMYDLYWAVNIFYDNHDITVNNLRIKDCQYGGLKLSSELYESPIIDADSIRIENCVIPLKIDHYAYTHQLNNMEFINNSNNYILLPLRSQGYNEDLHFLNYDIPYYISTNESPSKEINLLSNSFVVDAGTEFLMGDYAKITVSGDFITSGIAGDSVIFNSHSTVSYWKGFSLGVGATNLISMDYTVIRQSNDSNSGMSAIGSGNMSFTNSALEGGIFCGITASPSIIIDSTSSTFTAITPICQ